MHRRRKGCQLTHVMWRLLRPPSQYRWRRTKILLSLVFPRTCQQFVWVPEKILSYKQMQEGNAFDIKFWLFDPNHSLSDVHWVFDNTFRENIVLICLLLSWKGDSFGDSCVVCPADLDCLPGKPRKFSFDPLAAKSGQSHFLFSCLTVVSSFTALAGTSAGTFWESNTTIS